MKNKPSWTDVKLILALLGLAAPNCLPAAESPGRLLTTAAAVRNLSPTEAELHHPVKLRATVTFYDETLFSRFVQDATAGIYVRELATMPALRPGQEVEVEGVAGPGEYAPVIIPTSVKVISEGKLPVAQPVSLTQLVSGVEDSQLVEFSGVVRSVRFEKDTQYFLIDFVTGGERFTVYTKQLPVAQSQNLVDSTVKVRGVCATMFNHQRQLFGIRLLVPGAEAFAIEKPAPAAPYDLPVRKIDSLLQFTPEGSLGARVKVTGTVVYGEPGSAICIQDDASGLYCQTLQRDIVRPGDQVEVLGFPARGQYTPILEDAIYRKIGSGTEPKAEAVDVNAILTGAHDSRLVELPANVLTRVQRGLNQFLLLQSGELTFQAYLPQKVNDEDLAAIQDGAEVMVTGLCLIERGNHWQAGEKWRAASFHLLLRSPKDVSVIQNPSAAKLPDELWIATACGVIALGALLWVAALKRKVRHQAQIIESTPVGGARAAGPGGSQTQPSKV